MQYDAHECFLQLLIKIHPSMDDCMFKVDKLESTISNDCVHTTNDDGVCIYWSLHLADSSNFQTISGMLHQLMDLRGEYLENYRWLSKVEYINNAQMAVKS